MGNISNSTGDRYKDLIESISMEIKHLDKRELKTIILRDLWGKPFNELNDTLEELINARVDKTVGVETIMEEKSNESKYKIEDLVGRKFKTGSRTNRTLYKISKVEEDKVIIGWGEDEDITYHVGEVLGFIANGTWRLEEVKSEVCDEPKYKIEDLVGRKFKIRSNNAMDYVYTISEVKKGEVIIAWHDFDNIPKSIDYISHQVLDNIENGIWILEEVKSPISNFE